MASQSIARPRGARSQAIAALAMLLLLWGWVFRATLVEMFVIWQTVETFAHCFFILPISLFLIWQKRQQLASQAIKSEPKLLMILVALLLVWALSQRLGLQVGMQFSVVAMVPAMVWLVMGTQWSNTVCFPLLFLLFAVPFGEFLIPSLQQITALMCVYLLQLTSMPIYQEGNFIFIPGASFEVAWTCSGIRYLIATFCLGNLFAYLNFSSFKKRLWFCLFAIVFPIVANGLRAWSIIMIYYHVDTRIAGETDHLIYGWIFFGVLIFSLFAVGRWFADPIQETEHKARPAKVKRYAWWPAGGAVLIILSVPGLSWLNHQPIYHQNKVHFSLTPLQGWQGPNAPHFDWQARFINADLIWHQGFARQSQQLELFIAWYQSEAPGKELITFNNRLFNPDDWRLLKRQSTHLTLDMGDIPVMRSVLSNHTRELQLIHWYQVANKSSVGTLSTKLNQLIAAPFGPSSGAAIVIAAPVAMSEKEISAFLSAHWQPLVQSLQDLPQSSRLLTARQP